MIVSLLLLVGLSRVLKGVNNYTTTVVVPGGLRWSRQIINNTSYFYFGRPTLWQFNTKEEKKALFGLVIGTSSFNGTYSSIFHTYVMKISGDLPCPSWPCLAGPSSFGTTASTSSTSGASWSSKALGGQPSSAGIAKYITKDIKSDHIWWYRMNTKTNEIQWNERQPHETKWNQQQRNLSPL